MASTVISFYSIAKLFSGNEKMIERGENAYKSGHVMEFASDLVVGRIYGRVQASMRSVQYDVEVFLDDDFVITGSACTCARGEDVCHHRAALLLHAKEHLSKTDAPCKWVRRKEAATVTSVDDMYGGKMSTVLNRDVDSADREWFAQQLSTCNRFTGFGWLMSPEPEQQTAAVPAAIVSDLIIQPGFHAAVDKCDFIMKQLVIATDAVENTATATAGQRDNSEWASVRRGRLTASNFGCVLKSIDSGRQPPKSLLKKLLGQYDIGGLKAIQWGCNLESTAIAAYEGHTNTSVTPTGIWLSTTGCLGASPDGLVGDSKIIEVKCPYRLREAAVMDNVNQADFFVMLDDDGQCVLNQRTVDGFNYYHQVQGNLALTGREICDFCVWTPQDLVIFPVARDANWLSNIDKLEHFYRNCFLPEFISCCI